jgi:hypothetical protein
LKDLKKHINELKKQLKTSDEVGFVPNILNPCY